jgi:predicted  nucleic acid-binding Zn-ribbon protein
VAQTLSQEIRAELRDLGEAQQAILDKIGALVTAQAVMQNDLKRATQALEETQRTLRGENGNPGLVARVQNIEKAQDALNNLTAAVMGDKTAKGLDERVRVLETGIVEVTGEVKVLKDEIYGKQDGQQKDPGLLERMRLIEGFIGSMKNWGRLVFGAILADLAVRLWPHVAAIFANKP